MAINKVVNKSTGSHAAMRNVLEYVLRDEKIKDGHVCISGPYPWETIGYDEVYRTWLEEKRLWDKDSGRMYAHNIISFHRDEKITEAEALDLARVFAEKYFSGFQYVICVHQDKDHIHAHIVTNSVSYLDGHKLHQTRKDLERQKEFTNSLCRERGLTIAEKGKHFDGSLIEEGEIIAWSKDKYNLLINDFKKSFLAECGIALLEVIPVSASREEFISGMNKRGWSVQWEDNRKHIVFTNNNGDKVRDTNIEKTFTGLKVSKEALTHEFERQNEIRQENRDTDEAGFAGAAIPSGSGSDGNERNDTGSVREDTESLIREVRADIRDSRSESGIIIRTENKSVSDDEQSKILERERRLEEQRRAREQERDERSRRKMHRFRDRER